MSIVRNPPAAKGQNILQDNGCEMEEQKEEDGEEKEGFPSGKVTH